MSELTLACAYYEICGGQLTLDAQEAEIYGGEEYICPECFDADEIAFFETIGWSDADALASAGFGMDEDY